MAVMDWHKRYLYPHEVEEPDPMRSLQAYRRYEHEDLREALLSEFRRLAPRDMEGWIHERLDVLDTAIEVCDAMQRYFTSPRESKRPTAKVVET